MESPSLGIKVQRLVDAADELGLRLRCGEGGLQREITNREVQKPGLVLTGLSGASVRFTMGAFNLSLDPITVLIGCGVGLGTGLLGTLPAAARALRMPIVEGLKTI